MNVTRAQSSEREQYLAQIDRLVNSHVLHGSESLCKLLRYLAEHALDHHGLSLKEYQIATEVFGRAPSLIRSPIRPSECRPGVSASKLRNIIRPRERTTSRWKCQRAPTCFHSTAGSQCGRSTCARRRTHQERSWPGENRACGPWCRYFCPCCLPAVAHSPASAEPELRPAIGAVRTVPGGIYRFLEKLCDRTGRALGNFQQWCFRWTAGDRHAVFRFRP